MLIGNLKIHGVIYKITNKVNNKVYIGQTMKENGFNDRYNSKGVGIERVYKRHKIFKDGGYGYNPHLLNAIEKYGYSAFEVIEVFDVAFSEKELNIKEKFWIHFYNSYENGYNRTLGGEGTSGFKGLTKENNPASREVVQLSLDGSFIKEWKCMAYAVEELGVMTSHIASVCKNEYGRKSAGGYLWVYKEDYNKDYNYIYKSNNTHNKKSIIKLSLNGEFIASYSSIQEAVDEDDTLNVKGISKCCNGNRKSYKGYLWIFEHNYDENANYEYNVQNNGKNKPILAFDSKMNYIGEYQTIKDVVDNFEYSRSSLQKHLHKKGNRIKNHAFIFKENYKLEAS